MNYKRITGLFVIIAFFVIIVYDFWVYSKAGTEGTISWFVYDKSHEHPMIPFGVGVICGHFFWQMKKKRNN
jgi:hypothetical protein